MPGDIDWEAIYLLRRLIEKYRVKDTCICFFINLGEVYDSMLRKIMRWVLEMKEMSSRYIVVLKDMMMKCYSCDNYRR